MQRLILGLREMSKYGQQRYAPMKHICFIFCLHNSLVTWKIKNRFYSWFQIYWSETSPILK